MSSQWIDEFSKKVGAELSSAMRLAASLAADLHGKFVAHCENWNTRRAMRGGLVAFIGVAGVIYATHIAAAIYAATPPVVLSVLAFSGIVSAYGLGLLSEAISHLRFIRASRAPRP